MPAIRPPDLRAAMAALAVGFLLVRPQVTTAFPQHRHRYGERQDVQSFNTTLPGLGLRGSIQKLESAISTIDESLANNTDALDTAVDAVKGMHRRLTSIEDAVRDFELTIKQAITNVFNATRGRRLLDTANATDRRLLDTANATDRRLLDTLFNGTLGGT